MLKAKDIMTREVIAVTPETEISEVAGILLEKRINGVPVVDSDGRLIGIVCQSDLIAQQKAFPLPSVFNLLDSFIPLRAGKFEREVQKMAATTAAHAMTPDPVSVHPETAVEDVATLMVNKNFHTLPVVDEKRLVGIIGKEDVLRILISVRS
jgi:CBS domain-containing protein